MSRGIYCYYDDVKHETIYIGKDSNIDKNKRHKAHYQPSLKNQQKINIVLQNDLENNINRYTYVVLETSDDWTNEDLNEREKYWISLFKPKFNFTKGGDGVGSGENHPMYGKHHSEETRKKMSEAKKGKKHPMYGKKIPEETRKKMSKANSGENNPMYGRKHSEEARRKMSEAKSGENHPMYGKKISEETRKKMSKAHKGKKHSEETRKKMSDVQSGENHPSWKNYARIVKAGFNSSGKQRYALKYNGKIIKRSIYKEKLEKLTEEINNKQDK